MGVSWPEPLKKNGNMKIIKVKQNLVIKKGFTFTTEVKAKSNENYSIGDIFSHENGFFVIVRATYSDKSNKFWLQKIYGNNTQNHSKFVGEFLKEASIEDAERVQAQLSEFNETFKWHLI